jgi:GntR family transcriptional regulator
MYMQPEPTAGVVPLHYQIADAIRLEITSGILKAGDTVPSVGELCEQWNCAPGSAKTALAVLKNEGLISGGRGRPARVRKPASRIRLDMSMSQRGKALVLRPTAERRVEGAIEMTAGIPISDVISTHRYTVIDANEELAAEFTVDVGTELLRRAYEMTERHNGQRISWSISYIPKALIETNPELLDETREPWPGGHLHQLYTVGIEVDRFLRSVVAISPSVGERQKWGMETGVPLLYVRSRSIDITGRVVELSDAAYPADRTEIRFEEQLDRWPANYPQYSPEEEQPA